MNGSSRQRHIFTGNSVLCVNVLAGEIANLETRIANIVEIGTHLVMFCEIAAVRTAIASEALVYLDRSYRALSLPLRQ